MKSSLLRIVLLALTFTFISCSSGKFVDLNQLRSELKLKDFPTQKDYPEADALVLSEVHDVKVSINELYKLETVEEVKKITKLFKNIDDYASVEIPVLSGNRITDIFARTIKPNGDIIELKKDDFHTITGGGSDEVFYSDEKTVKFTFPAIEKNCIVEYGYRMYEPVPFIMDVWRIQGSIPKLQNIYRLTAPVILLSKGIGGAGWTWRYKSYNCYLEKPEFQRNVNPDGSVLGANVTFTWDEKDVQAFKPDPMMPPYRDYLAYVKFAPSAWETWNDISEWYYNELFKPQLIIPSSVSDKAKELTAGCTDDKGKIDKIFEFVRSLRYVAIELGDGGLIPNQPEKVLERKYGDCKDKSILLTAMLQSIGVKAEPVLVLTADNGKLDEYFPNWNFNHMIVKASDGAGGAYWLDPTAEYCRLGELPYNSQGIKVLVLHDDGTSGIETTPTSTYKDNKEDMKINVEFAGNDTAYFDISILYSGAFEHGYRSLLGEKTRDDMLKFCKTLVADDYLTAKVTDYSLDNLDSEKNHLVLRFKLKVPDAIQRQGNFIFLNADPFKVIDSWTWLAKDERKYDIKFDFSREVNKTIDITFKNGNYAVGSLPTDTKLREHGLYYSRNYIKTGERSFKTTETFSLISPVLDAKNYKNIKSFFNRMKSKLNEKIILSSGLSVK